ncbi:hypothetical protein HCH_00795 [Hahella chejuensis KCTC 2396]|uniref:Lipocalin-like domain-containing protein n=1 Tax=Hahella chejuensis (strain KCTC 2396) TaxID=349521 RepID=Q2SNT4_HAHCH|nr:hypothetical protein [Hahella chejuensis]ABC27690.1 hypothetical protein HCH_00795 [Hahella chejuensis KCTC 2396]
MKQVAVFVALIMLALGVQAAELSKQALQGSWLILTMNGESDDENDKWEFEGDNFYQNLGGRRISPDAFTVKGQTIDLGYAKIKVLAFDGDTMTADMAGFTYELKKE